MPPMFISAVRLYKPYQPFNLDWKYLRHKECIYNAIDSECKLISGSFTPDIENIFLSAIANRKYFITKSVYRTPCTQH